MSGKDTKKNPPNSYIPDEGEQEEYNEIIGNVVKGRNVIQKGYNQFNGRNLYDCIDDWQKRWMGYIPLTSSLTQDRSNMVLNFTRNTIISYIAKLDVPKIKILAVNTKSNKENQKFADGLTDLNEYSNNAENGDARFKECALDIAVKGTGIVYEGYLKQEQETEVPVDFNSETGEIKTEKQKKTVFDNAYRQLVPIEDFYIANPYQPDIQKQPFVIWKQFTTYEEAKWEFGHYPKFKFVKAGSYTVTAEPTTFYRNQLYTELNANQVEIIRYYHRMDNKHVILINGIPVYSGIIPRKDGKYPFAKGWHEPFDNNFFWGMGVPQKFMGEQDLANTLFNLMVDKGIGAMMPFGLSSDLDDLAEDTVLEPNKIRKVGDVNNWRFETLPGVTSGDQALLQTTISFLKENSGLDGGASSASPAGGKVTMRQAMLKQQEAAQKLGFTISYLEDFERDRTELRLGTILQFYSIPKINKISGAKGKDIEQMLYREIVIPNTKLSNGNTGTKVIKLIDNETANDKNKSKKLSDDMFSEELSAMDMAPEMDLNSLEGVQKLKKHLSSLPKEVMAINVESFYDYNTKIQVVKNSSHQKNQMMDRAERMEYANWRLNPQLAQQAPVNAVEVVKWVNESYDIDSSRFEAVAQNTPQPGEEPGQPGQPSNMPKPASAMAPSKNLGLDKML